MADPVLNDLMEIIEIGKKYHDHWFRGHSKSVYQLQPKIFRSECAHVIEASLYWRFKLEAPAFYSACPENDDYLSWLFLMQHHGLPTRLLDWTKSILIATFFAVSKNFNDESELWMLSHEKLNKKSGLKEFPMPKIHKHLDYICVEPFLRKPEDKDILKSFDLLERPKIPFAILPQVAFERMKVQQSSFTIHPEKSRETEFSKPHGDCVVRYVIPKDAKKDILRDLYYLGINDTQILPSLDGLARNLVNRAVELRLRE